MRERVHQSICERCKRGGCGVWDTKELESVLRGGGMKEMGDRVHRKLKLSPAREWKSLYGRAPKHNVNMQTA